MRWKEKVIEPQNGKAPYEVKSEWILQCVSCLEKAEVLFEGTSFCRGCLKEKLRTGEL